MAAEVSARSRGSLTPGGWRRVALASCLVCALGAFLAPAAGAATFANTAPIAIPVTGNATPYPSPIVVSGLTGQITDVNVTLSNYTHTDPEDVAAVLVPPSGTNILLMDGPGGTSEVAGVNVTFDDSAANRLPSDAAFPSGSYKPSAYFSGDVFPAPGPLANYCNPGPIAGGTCTLASALNGNNPNGTWNLYVIDVDGPDAGTIAGGWSLDITTGVVVQRTLTVSRGGTGSGTVTGTGINCGADCTEAYNDGSSVVLTAAPAAGSTFAGWTGCDNANANTCTMSMSANKAVTANFTLTPPTQRTLTVSKSGTGSGMVTGTGINCGIDCTESYDDGSSVSLTATPAAGSTFAGWTGCDNATANACTMSMTANKTVTARFNTTTPPVNPKPRPIPVPTSDKTKPVLSGLSLSPTRFRAASSGPAIATVVGANVTYKLSEAAAVRFRVERALAGRRSGGRCVKPKRSNRRAKKCTRYVLLSGGFTHQGKSGSNTFKFSGRLGGRKLKPGRYRLRAVATDASGNQSRVGRARFRIVRR